MMQLLKYYPTIIDANAIHLSTCFQYAKASHGRYFYLRDSQPWKIVQHEPH